MGRIIPVYLLGLVMGFARDWDFLDDELVPPGFFLAVFTILIFLHAGIDVIGFRGGLPPLSKWRLSEAGVNRASLLLGVGMFTAIALTSFTIRHFSKEGAEFILIPLVSGFCTRLTTLATFRALLSRGLLQLPPLGACQTCGFLFDDDPPKEACPECGAARATGLESTP